MKRKWLAAVFLGVVAVVMAGATIKVTRDPVIGTHVWFAKYGESCDGGATTNPC